MSGNDSTTLVAFKNICVLCFHMKDLGVLKYFLGIKVAHSRDGIFFCGTKPATFLMEQNNHLGRSTSPLFENTERCRRLVGRLIYLSFTRPWVMLCISCHNFLHASRRDH